MKKMVLSIIFLLVMQTVSADVLITEIMYNPDQAADTAAEWIELYNNGNTAVDLSNWKINNNDFDDTTIAANEYLVVARTLTGSPSFESIWGNNDGVWNANDGFKAVDGSLSLTNTGDVINLSNGIYSDIVTYSSSQGANGNNKTLERVSATEWTESTIVGGTPGRANNQTLPSENSAQLTLQVIVADTAPIINSITITPDEDPSQGVQLIPNLGSNKTITISTTITDEEIDTVTARINQKTINLVLSQTINSTTAIYSANYSMQSHYAPGTYTVNVTVTDTALQQTSSQASFEYLTSIGIELNPTSLTLTKQNPAQTTAIKNLGNVILDLEIYGTNLESGQNILQANAISYALNGPYKQLQTTPVFEDANIATQGNQQLSFMLQLPQTTPTGTYIGTVNINAISS